MHRQSLAPPSIHEWRLSEGAYCKYSREDVTLLLSTECHGSPLVIAVTRRAISQPAVTWESGGRLTPALCW